MGTGANGKYFVRLGNNVSISRECHERRLRERNMYTEEQISWMLDRTQLYSLHNQDNPGFFDMFINSGKVFL